MKLLYSLWTSCESFQKLQEFLQIDKKKKKHYMAVSFPDIQRQLWQIH